jgi:hypothetical protein
MDKRARLEMVGMKEPRWRTVLCWGAIVTFFTVPMAGLGILFIADQFPSIRNHLTEYKFIGPFFQSVTALVFGLAGLNSADRYVEQKNGKLPSKKTPIEIHE